MAKASLQYLQLLPTSDSRFSIEDARELISYLSEVSHRDPFKLIIKSRAGRGLELYCGISPKSTESIKRHIYAISPDLSIINVKSREVLINKPTINGGYRFSRHYAYPMFYSSDTKGDELAKLMRTLGQIDNQQSVEISLTAKPTRSLKAELLRTRLLKGSSPKLYDPGSSGTAKLITLSALHMVVISLRAAIYLLQNLNHPTSLEPGRLTKIHKVVGPRDVMLLDKLYEPLFKASLSLSVKTTSISSASSLLKDIHSGLNSFATKTGYQQFKQSKTTSQVDLYSASDLASLFRIDKPSLKTGLYSLQRFKSLPVDAELIKQPTPGDIVLGINSYQGVNHDLVLKHEARQRHLYISGATGSGKSTLLANLILQDIDSGQGLSLIDPHGDLAADVMQRLPKERLNDVIYFDPAEPKSKLSINLLETKAKPDSPEYSQEKDQLTESIISLFRKVFSDEDSGGHRIEYILRNCIHTALDIPASNIFTIFRLLTDGAYRLSVLPTIKDQNLANFWRNELGRAGEYQRVKMTAGITSKIGRFLFSEPSRRVFGQASTTLDVASIMDERQILICNFAKGKLGEDGSRLFSAAMLTKLQLAALKRANISAKERHEHYLYIDEFQNHAPSSVIQMLSEARKYGLYLTMGEQSPYQQDSQSTKVIMANVGNLLCFRTVLPKDEGLIMPNFSSYITSADLNNLPAYKFYFKTSSELVIAPTSGQSYPIREVDDEAGIEDLMVNYGRSSHRLDKHPRAA